MQKKIKIGILLVALFFVAIGGFQTMSDNTSACADYWGAECSSYNPINKICACDNGEHVTTSEMINEANELRHVDYKYSLGNNKPQKEDTETSIYLSEFLSK